jgi:hypothetical protein
MVDGGHCAGTVQRLTSIYSPAGGEGEFLDDLPIVEQAAEAPATPRIVLRRGHMLL